MTTSKFEEETGRLSKIGEVVISVLNHCICYILNADTKTGQIVNYI